MSLLDIFFQVRFFMLLSQTYLSLGVFMYLNSILRNTSYQFFLRSDCASYFPECAFTL